MKHVLLLSFVVFLLTGTKTVRSAPHYTRLKDIVHIEGVRDNQLVGYGLIVGLNGTGDGLQGSPFTRESLVAMLERLGVNTRDQIQAIKTKNVAAVMVTANLPPFSRQGSRIDVSISAVGDAKDLTGGTLLVTPLMGADGNVHAVAQGAVSTSAIAARGQSGSTFTKGVPTSGKISGGATVEKETIDPFNATRTIKLSLKNPDFTTAQRIAQTINQRQQAEAPLGKPRKNPPLAKALDPSTVEIRVPAKETPLHFVSSIEHMLIEPDQVARVVLDEQNGIVVMGENVRISTVAISQGNLTVRVNEEKEVWMPSINKLTQKTTNITNNTSNPQSSPQNTTTPPTGTMPFDERSGLHSVPFVVADKSTVDVTEDSKKIAILHRNTTLQDLVSGLNDLGVGSRDIIAIIQNIAAAGALQAQIEVR